MGPIFVMNFSFNDATDRTSFLVWNMGRGYDQEKKNIYAKSGDVNALESTISIGISRARPVPFSARMACRRLLFWSAPVILFSRDESSSGKETPMGAALVFLIIVAAVLVFAVGIYNSLISLRNRVDNAWAQVDVQLRRRYDLIPNLVETVKGYARHEREVFQNVTDARSRAINASNVKDQAAAENQLTGALKSLFAVAEAYPELKANQNFMMLQEELAGTEGKIAYARQFYNDQVMRFNQKQQMFPSNIIANMFHFTEREFFKIEEPAAKEPVKVQF
jgi:LemA protein